VPHRNTAVKGAFVHHTVDGNSYTASQVPAIIRAIYAYHVLGRGWNDIGYNFLIDRFGRIWEGRFGGMDRPVIGAHSGPQRLLLRGSVIGNFDLVPVPTAMTSAFVRLIAWKAQLHQFDPAGIANISGDTLHSVSGHRDTYSTSCPGRYLYAKLPAIRAAAAALVDGLPSLSINRDMDNHNHGDVLATNGNHDLLLYSGTGHGTTTAPKVVSHGGWVGVDLATIVGDGMVTVPSTSWLARCARASFSCTPGAVSEPSTRGGSSAPGGRVSPPSWHPATGAGTAAPTCSVGPGTAICASTPATVVAASGRHAWSVSDGPG
jgi:hypothetical protein